MKIPPVYSINSELLDLIAKIEANRIILSSINIPSILKEKIQRASILKSSLFSARIEGNTLTLEDFESGKSEKNKKREILNILKATEFINKKIKSGKKISKSEILNLHLIVMKDLGRAGKFRKEVSAIFNQAGVAVYIPPPPKEIPILMDNLFDYVNFDKEKFPVVNAFISHLVFEKIHPFLDGNGRVGRLLIFLVLKSKNCGFEISVPFEEYLDEHKNEYYYHLDRGLKETNDYLFFMLDAFYKQTERLKEMINREIEKKEKIFLPPRQEEILNIIKDHKIVSFDRVRRRFLKVPERTLRYDLKKLLDLKIIERAGKTKGSYYRIKE